MTAHKYYKRGLVIAEQFDGSAEMAEKMLPGCERGNNEVWLRNAFDTEGNFIYQDELKVGDWAVPNDYATVLMSDEDFHSTYAELPVIPQAVSEYIKWGKEHGESLYSMIADYPAHLSYEVEQFVMDWMPDHSDTFALAWLLGEWEVENG